MASMEICISENNAGGRLDAVLSGIDTDMSRAAIQKAIRNGACTIDGQVILQPATKTRLGQKIILSPSVPNNSLQPLAEEVNVIWCDAHIAVCNKPPGVSVHPCPSCSEPTYVHRLLARFPQLKQQEGARPGIVHRLDKDTSGLMLVALTEGARLKLSDAFAHRQIHKEYLALACGEVPMEGECHEAIARHPSIKTRMAVADEHKGGKPALTSWKRLWHFENDISLLAVKIHTGRTHQIRVHLSNMGYPIIGDKTYGNRISGLMAPRQMLHAWKISFVHPVSGERLAFTAPPPEDFIRAALEAQNRMRKIIVTGNQGCGKSAFCAELAKRNVPTISADEIVAKLYKSGGAAADWLKFRFGEDVLDLAGNVNKTALFNLMNNDRFLRKEVEMCIHALVRRELEIFFEQNELAGMSESLAEIPLFFESGLRNEFGAGVVIVGVDCPRETRWQRLKNQRGWEDEKIITIEKWQMDEKNKMAACDYVVPNGKELRNLHVEAGRFLDWLRERKENSAAQLKNTLDKIWKN